MKQDKLALRSEYSLRILIGDQHLLVQHFTYVSDFISYVCQRETWTLNYILLLLFVYPLDVVKHKYKDKIINLLYNITSDLPLRIRRFSAKQKVITTDLEN